MDNILWTDRNDKTGQHFMDGATTAIYITRFGDTSIIHSFISYRIGKSNVMVYILLHFFNFIFFKK